jgi:ribosomal protein L7/L12
VLAVFFWALRRRAGERNDLIAPPRSESARSTSPSPASAAVAAVGQVEVPEELKQELWKLIHTGNPIMAIKLVRDRTGVGLKEAHDYIEAMRQNDVTLR